MELVIFDLDGTLIDSKLDLAHAVNASRKHMGLPPIENETVYSYVGNGAPILMRRAMGPAASDEQVEESLRFFLAYYRDHMLEYTRLYPGVKVALDQLLAAKIPMAILTNKPVRISEAIVAGLGLEKHFFQIYGGNSFEQKKPDPVGINSLIQESGAKRTATLMVGDSSVDMQTARNASTLACGVTFGFQPESLREVVPDFLIDKMEELVPIVLSKG